MGLITVHVQKKPFSARNKDQRHVNGKKENKTLKRIATKIKIHNKQTLEFLIINSRKKALYTNQSTTTTIKRRRAYIDPIQETSSILGGKRRRWC